jgi:hypothetical protein
VNGQLPVFERCVQGMDPEGGGCLIRLMTVDANLHRRWKGRLSAELSDITPGEFGEFVGCCYGRSIGIHLIAGETFPDSTAWGCAAAKS